MTTVTPSRPDDSADALGDTTFPSGPPPLLDDDYAPPLDDNDYSEYDGDAYGYDYEPPLDDDPYSDVPPPLLDDESDDSGPAVPSAWEELRIANRGLYNRARDAGLIRATTDPASLLKDDLTSSLIDHLNKVPTGPLPQPLARDLDVAAVIADILRNRVRWYRNEDVAEGGNAEMWDGTRWVVMGTAELESVTGSLIHPVPNSDIPQLVRPVNATKISKDRAMELQADGLAVLNDDTKRITVPGTDIALQCTYAPAEDWTGRVMTVRNIVTQLRGMLLSQTPLDLDIKDPARWNINLANGHVLELGRDNVVDPATGDFTVTVRPVERTDLVRKRTRAGWNPDADGDPARWCPTWSAFIRDVCSVYDPSTQQWVTRPDHERALQTFAGATLLPIPAAHRMGLLYGDFGNNGKSLTVDTLMDVLGDYAYKLDPQPLMRTRGSDPHPTDLMGMVGARLVVVHEMERTAWDSTKTKRQVDDKTIKARRMGQDMGTYPRTANLWVTANETPSVSGDTGFWKRIVLFPFDARWFSPDDSDELKDVSIAPADDELGDKLEAEADGIILWMLHGLWMYYTQGLAIPDSMQETKRDARDSASEWTQFCDEFVVATEDPADVLDDKLIWEVWKSYVDSFLQGKFERPSKPMQVPHEFQHVFPKAQRRGRGRKGAGTRERNGFGGVKFTKQAVNQFGFVISQYTAKVDGTRTLNGVPPLNPPLSVVAGTSTGAPF